MSEPRVKSPTTSSRSTCAVCQGMHGTPQPQHVHAHIRLSPLPALGWAGQPVTGGSTSTVTGRSHLLLLSDNLVLPLPPLQTLP